MIQTVQKLWPFGYVREIPREMGRYLTRWSVREQKPTGGGGWRAYIHRFWSGDLELHDHPWRWSFSLILWGSYTERYADLITRPPTSIEAVRLTAAGAANYTEVQELGPVRTRRVRWFNWIPATRFHQIIELHGTVWTAFFSGPLHGRSWGFWVPDRGLVHHKARKVERGLPPQ